MLLKKTYQFTVPTSFGTRKISFISTPTYQYINSRPDGDTIMGRSVATSGRLETISLRRRQCYAAAEREYLPHCCYNTIILLFIMMMMMIDEEVYNVHILL